MVSHRTILNDNMLRDIGDECISSDIIGLIKITFDRMFDLFKSGLFCNCRYFRFHSHIDSLYSPVLINNMFLIN